MNAAPGWVRPLGTTGLEVSALGFGAYRIREDETDHLDALRSALTEGGVNLVDTSTNYGLGASERAIGQVLRELIEAGELAREEIVVVSKIGYVQGAWLDEMRLEEEIAPLDYPVARVGDDHWHSVSPAAISRGLRASLARLGLETIDVMLLHNPEYLIDPGPPQAANSPLFQRVDAFYEGLEASFAVLEEAVEKGQIGCYGVSSNALVDGPMSDRRTSLERFLEAAEAAGGDGHHLRVIQLPLNAIEAQATRASKTEAALLDRCRDAGLAVMTNRPMNALVSGHVVRLADPGPVADAERFAPARQALGRLEAAIGAQQDGHPLPTWSKELPVSMRKLFGTVAFDDFQANYADRKTEAALAALATQVREDPAGSELLERWLRDYLEVYATLMRAARAQLAVRDKRRLAPRLEEIERDLPPHLG
ncbi:MAG: aldo/keto reductase, partial [Myxococcota bacterium]|nr:aldo/keto reductase [Myxococcota bacterium]